MKQPETDFGQISGTLEIHFWYVDENKKVPYTKTGEEWLLDGHKL